MDWSKYYPANYTAITPEDIEMIKELKQNPPVEEDASNDKSDDGEGMDKVDPKAVKKKFKDRKDKDLDNDGDEDEGDEVIHARRKAIDKAVDDEEEEDEKKEDVQVEHKGKKAHAHPHDGTEDEPEEPEFSKKQAGDRTVPKESVSHGKPGAIDIYKETIALAKVTRGKDRLSLEGAAKLIKQRSYDKLAPYLDSMEEEPRQSVLMILMNDQKIADKVMKKMKTEKYHGWLMSEMVRKYDGLTWTEIGERLIKTPERRLVALAYATKMGTIDAPSPEVQKLANECDLADLERAAGEIIGEDDDLKEAKSEAEKIADKNKKDQKKKAGNTNQANQADAKKADAERSSDSAANDKEQEKRMAANEKERDKKRKDQERMRAKEIDDPTIKRDQGPTTRRAKAAGIAHAALSALEDVEEVPETIDASCKVFKEKIRKLAYEKAKEIIANRERNSEPDVTREAKKEEDSEDIGSKVKETGKVDNKIKMEPTVKESTGVSFVRKYKQKLAEQQEDATLENSILEYMGQLAGSSFGGVGQANPAGAEFATDDTPASATSIARALRCSPMRVQKLLDDMVEAGQISRVGDAYTYASPRAAEPMGDPPA